MNSKMIILRCLIAFLLFFCGNWIFNHVDAWMGVVVIAICILYCAYQIGNLINPKTPKNE